MPTLYGNTTGLSPSATRQLERIYRRKVPLDAITTPELNRVLAEASQETRRQVGVLVARSGDIEQVIVGDTSKLMLPDVGRLRAAEGRLRGVRLIHTHLFGEELSKDDIVDLVRLRLDLLAAVLLTPEGEPRSIHYAYNVPPAPRSKSTEAERVPPYRTVGPVLVGRLDVNFGELVRSLEDELARSVKALKINEAKDGRAILVHVAEKSKPDSLRHAEERLRELAELARTAGVDVVDTVLQVRDRLDPRHVLGKGKLDEVVLRAAELDARCSSSITTSRPSQASSISARHRAEGHRPHAAHPRHLRAARGDRDGKLQVELAQLKYALPRLGQKDDSLSRLTGGIGGRGPGETKLEIGRRRARSGSAHLERSRSCRSSASQRRKRGLARRPDRQRSSATRTRARARC
jgi:GTP-binding protein HflX